MITCGFCFKAGREEKPPAERGDLSTSNEENGGEAASLQSAPLVSQHVKHSQHDTKYIKVWDCYHRFTEHPSPCTGDLRSAFSLFFSWQGVSTASEAKLFKGLFVFVSTS